MGRATRRCWFAKKKARCNAWEFKKKKKKIIGHPNEIATLHFLSISKIHVTNDKISSSRLINAKVGEMYWVAQIPWEYPEYTWDIPWIFLIFRHVTNSRDISGYDLHRAGVTGSSRSWTVAVLVFSLLVYCNVTLCSNKSTSSNWDNEINMCDLFSSSLYLGENGEKIETLKEIRWKS
jgi:hypothetical protein